MSLKKVIMTCVILLASSMAIAEVIQTSVTDDQDNGPQSGYYGGATSVVRSRYHWEPYRGFMPVNAVIGGGERGRILYICQTNYQNGTHPGKVVDGRCNISFGGKEISQDNFRVLVGKRTQWVRGYSRNIPGNAIAGGYENGRTLFICRAYYRGGMHPGKLVDGRCNIGYGGREIVTPGFELLVSQQRGPRAEVYDNDGYGNGGPIGATAPR